MEPVFAVISPRLSLGGLADYARELAKMQQWARGSPSARAASSGAATQNLVSYQGGNDGIGVTNGHEKVYLVFYGSQWGGVNTNASGDVTLSSDPSGEAPYLQEFFKGLGTGQELWSGIMTQYCQSVFAGTTICPPGNTQHVAYPLGGALAGVWVDESAASPAAATRIQLAEEAVSAAGHFGNVTAASNRNAQYFIVSPTGTSPDHFLTGDFCAWHSDNTAAGVTSPWGDIAFVNMPYVTDRGATCGKGWVNSPGTDDGFSIVAGHEYAETITDQESGGGWLDPTLNEGEVGDKCAWIPAGQAGGVFDLSTGTGAYAMQTIWSNNANSDSGGCADSGPIAGLDARPGLALYNPSSGASYVELADGSGGWSGVQGPEFSAGWNVYPGSYNRDRF